MSEPIGRVIQSVVAHNKLWECDLMWQQQRQESAESKRQPTVESAPRIDRSAEIKQARREASTRKLESRSAASVPADAARESVSSSSDDDSDSSDRHKKKKRRKEEKKHRKKEKHSSSKREKKSSKHKKEKHKKEHKKEAHCETGASMAEASSAAAAPPSVMGAAFADSDDEAEGQTSRRLECGEGAPRAVMGAQRPEEALAATERAQRIHKVWDASLGVYRAVRESGEVVEMSVSRAEQQAMVRAKARVVPAPSKEGIDGPIVGPTAGPTRVAQGSSAHSYTGREKFPSQHPWFGYK